MTQTGNADSAFDGFKDRFIEAFWEQQPTWASAQGYHNYDSVLKIPDAAGRNALVQFSKSQLDSLHQFQLEKLSKNNRTDFHIIEDQLRSMVWRVEELRDWEWDPSGYNVGETFATMLNNDYDSLDNRLRNFGKHPMTESVSISQ